MTGKERIAGIVKLFGGQSALSELSSIPQTTISDWVSKGRIPSHRVTELIDLGAAMAPPIKLEANDFFPPPPLGSKTENGLSAQVSV